MRGNAFARIVAAVTRRPLAVLAVTALLALGGAALALRLEPSAATDTLVDSDSDSFQATERFKQNFGDDAVVVLVRGELSKTVLTDDLGRVLRLEGCLSGNVPDNEQGLGSLPPVCREIAEAKPAKVVFGPATFINTAVNGILDELAKRQAAAQRQAASAAKAARQLSERRGDPPAEQERLARAASEAVSAQFTQYVLQLALRYGIIGGGFITGFQWTQIQGALVQIQNAGTPVATFIAPPTAGLLVFQLTVTDQLGFTSTDTVVANVFLNLKLVANAG